MKRAVVCGLKGEHVHDLLKTAAQFLPLISLVLSSFFEEKTEEKRRGKYSFVLLSFTTEREQRAESREQRRMKCDYDLATKRLHPDGA